MTAQHDDSGCEQPQRDEIGSKNSGAGIDETSPVDANVGLESKEHRYELLILQSLRRIVRAIDIHSKRLKTEHQITGPQLVSLSIIVENGPLTSKEIARQVHLSPSTIVGILDRLESKGWIMRLRNAADRRAVNVSATPSGVNVVRKAPSPLQEGLAQALQQLSNIEQVSIAASLQRIVDFMEASKIDAAPILETGQLSPDNDKNPGNK